MHRALLNRSLLGRNLISTNSIAWTREVAAEVRVLHEGCEAQSRARRSAPLAGALLDVVGVQVLAERRVLARVVDAQLDERTLAILANRRSSA